MTTDLSTTAVNYLTDVADKTGATFERLAAAWSATRNTDSDQDRALQLQTWASRNGSFWQEIDRHPDYRLAASVWRSRSFGQGDNPHRSLQFTQCSMAPTKLGLRSDYMRATWDPAGAMLLTSQVELLDGHDGAVVLGTVDALVREGVDVHTVVTLSRGALQDDVLAGVILGEGVGISWAVSGLESERSGDRLHHRTSVVVHAGLTHAPRVANVRPPILVRPTVRDSVLARANPRYDFDTGQVMRPASRARTPQVERYALPPGAQLTDDQTHTRKLMAEAMQRGTAVRVTGEDRVMRTAFSGTDLRVVR